MAIYICEGCGDLKDDDHDPCTEHPTVHCGLLCGECAGELCADAE